MITYHYLHTFVVLNLAIVGILILTALVFKKAAGIMLFLSSLCWMGFSWFYQLKVSSLVPSGLLSDHALLEWFLTFVYGFGVWASVMLVFLFGVVGISQLLSPDITVGKKSRKSVHDHSPWPLWTVCVLMGLASAWLLRDARIPQLNKLMEYFTGLIYGKLLQVNTGFPAFYLPAAGIAAGTVVTACFSGVYRRAGVPALCFLSLPLVPVLTAVFAPLVDFAGSVMVIILVVAAYVMKDQDADVPQRSSLPFILLALGTGCLSGLYFYANGLVIYRDEKVLTIVGGIAAGITIACLAYRSFSCEDSIFRALYFLGLIPFCTPGFSSGVAYILALAGAAIFLCAGLSGTTDRWRKTDSPKWAPEGGPVEDHGYGNISFAERGQMVDAQKSVLWEDTYIGTDGREYRQNGDGLERAR